MRKLLTVTFAVAFAAMLMGSVVAGDKTVTLEGKIVCAKCAMHEESRKECQNVLVVDQQGKEQHYYLAKSEANDKLGYVCTATKAVRVTGSVSEKDGKMWLAATEIAPVTTEG